MKTVCDKCGSDEIKTIYFNSLGKEETMKMSEYPGPSMQNAVYRPTTAKLTCKACGFTLDRTF